MTKEFPSERILTVSARDYRRSTNKLLSKYEMVGVHKVVLAKDRGFVSALELFAEEVPENTEVVVDYRVETSVGHAFFSGTALIPLER